jgi:hypothetical protein
MAPPDSPRRPPALTALIGLLIFQGVSAAPPGLMLAIDPTGAAMQMPAGDLAGSPFRDYLIPGIILCVVLGLGAFFVAACLFRPPRWGAARPFGRHWAWAASGAFGVALMIWIVVQISMIGLGSWLQPLYFAVGLAIVGLTLAPSVRSRLGAGREIVQRPCSTKAW